MADLLRQFRATQAMRQRPIDTWVRECIGPLWRPAPHLEVILRLFERMEREPILACLSMPPGAGKTETLLACLAWFMARNPGDTNAYVSYSSSVTRRKSDRAREHCLRGGWVPHDHLWGLGEWRGAANGGLIATGVGGRLTGDRIGGVLVVDDPFKNELDAASPVRRDFVSAWLDGVAFTRRIPGRASLLLVQARWDPDDAIGRVRAVVDEQGRKMWEAHSVSAIDSEGQSFWPAVFPLAELMRIKAQLDARNPHLWASLYLQEPVRRGGKLFRAEPARYMQQDVVGRHPTLGVDVAVGGRARNDHNATVLLWTRGRSVDAVSDVWNVNVWQSEGPEAIERIYDDRQRVQVDGRRVDDVTLGWEVNGVGLPMLQQFQRKYPGAHVHRIQRSTSKYVETTPTAAAFNQGLVRYPLAAPWLSAHLDRVRSFTGAQGAFDDDVDALVNARRAALAGGTSSGVVG